MIDAIVAEAAADRHARGIEVLGARGVLEQDPFGRPEKSKKSPAPHFHAASKKAFMDLKAAYSEFYAEYREAAEKLKAGERLVEFPEGCFPPGLPFVEPAPALAGNLLSAETTASLLSEPAALIAQDIPLPGGPEEVPGRSAAAPSFQLTPPTDTPPLGPRDPPTGSVESRAESRTNEDTGKRCAATGSDRRPRPP